MLTLSALIALPGIVVHELGHYLFCRLCGVEVREVVFFQLEGPGGYVVHAVPRRMIQHAVIVAGPLLVNSSLTYLLFRSATADGMLIASGSADDPVTSGLRVGLAVLLGASIGMQAIPSHADAASLWNVAVDHVRRGRLLATLAIPAAALLLLVNLLRRFWIDWLYLGALALAAWFLPAR